MCVDSISNTTHTSHTLRRAACIYVATALPFLPSPRKKIGCYTQPSTHTHNGYTLTATTTNYYFNTHHNITHTPSSQHLIDAMMKSFSYSPLHTHTQWIRSLEIHQHTTFYNNTPRIIVIDVMQEDEFQFLCFQKTKKNLENIF